MKTKKVFSVLLSVLLLFIVGFVYYYITLPAINVHCKGFWYSIIFLLFALCAVMGFLTLKNERVFKSTHEITGRDFKLACKSILFKITFIAAIIVVIVYIGGSLLSSPIVNSDKYQQLISISHSNFNEDIDQISYNEIPVLDKDSAILIGSRKMGNMIEYVSQFDVSTEYTQINYQGKPVRVSPLEYANTIKWFTNQSSGIPAYIRIDMATQNVECVKLDQPIKYSKSELFGRNIYRYIRFQYPTYIFDDIVFEIGDDGTPYWICPVKDYTIGLFGGEKIKNVVVVNAITGEHINYKFEDVPTWIDHVYSANLLISYYDYYGSLKHGFINSIFGQKDCLQTTDGYNYIALDDDVWVYTGVTSVSQDKSNVGFVLMNQRTAETKYYDIPGAEENSAMASAEGKVQHLGYTATFPLFLNIAGEPTYFIALKDAAGLVKQYAMVNVSKYTIVAIGDSIPECEKSYRELLKSNNVTNADSSSTLEKTGVITKMFDAVIDGNSHVYLMLQNDDSIYDITIGDLIGIVKYNIGDTITVSYIEGIDSNTVLAIK